MPRVKAAARVPPAPVPCSPVNIVRLPLPGCRRPVPRPVPLSAALCCPVTWPLGGAVPVPVCWGPVARREGPVPVTAAVKGPRVPAAARNPVTPQVAVRNCTRSRHISRHFKGWLRGGGFWCASTCRACLRDQHTGLFSRGLRWDLLLSTSTRSKCAQLIIPAMYLYGCCS